MEKPFNFEGPLLVIIRGLPGSGKTYLADALAPALGTDRTITLDPDKIDQTSQEYLDFVEQQTRDGVDPKLHLYRWSRAKAFDAITQHKIIIWNQGFTNLETFNKMIDRLRDYAREHGSHLGLLVVEVEAGQQVAQARITERAKQIGRDVSDEAFARFVRDYHTFSGHGFEVVSVSGVDDVPTSVATVTKALSGLAARP